MDEDLKKILLNQGIIKNKDNYLEEIMNNPELKSFDDIIRALSRLGNKNHIDSEILSEYILYLNGDSSDKHKYEFLSSLIDDHLEDCADCRTEYEFLQKEYYEVNHFIERSFSEGKNNSIESVHSKSVGSKNYLTKFRNLYAVAASIAILFVFLFGYSKFTTPQYLQIVNSQTDFDFSTTRGRNSENFINAINYLEQQEYKTAIELLKRDLIDNEDRVTDFYSYYILGLAHLENSRSDFWGFFIQFNGSELQKAKQQFATSLELNNSGMFETINANAHFYLGQSYLLSEELIEAKKYLLKAVELKSEYSELASEILSSIQ